MNREILFRGKRFPYMEWVYGYYYSVKEEGDASDNDIWHWIVDENGRNWTVDPDTVGQYTGERDNMTGKQIFEGDIVKTFDGLYTAVVKYGNYQNPGNDDGFHCGFYLEWDKGTDYLRKEIAYWTHEQEVEVVGNIYDTPDMV